MGPNPSERPETIVKTVKSISAEALFKQYPSLRELLWGGSLWAVGYYWSVGKGAAVEVLREYVKNQGSKSEQEKVEQLALL
jgi:putative transposase